MGRLATSWRMFKASWHVLRTRKELAVFPLLSGVAALIVAVVFLTPAVFTVDFDHDRATPGTYVLLVAYYLVTAYVAIFFNAALVSQANIALTGGDPSVAGGLKVAGANWLRLLPWALLAATVSLVLRAIEERLGFLGRIVIGLIGMAWNLVTYLVLPVLVLEGVGTRDALRRSANLFRGTWGENVLGNAGIGVFGFLLFLPSIALVAIGAAAGGATAFVCVIIAIVWGLVVSIVTAALSGIYQTALYRYAADGTTAAEFAGADLGHAFPPRNR
ncbi:MAG TPA: DUF6159 family protein [Actinophytocola sp.]|uniref:DUF6159 family protein n=1 Tax=Actinophytocola sp. TaxID=1872138 RepID=UPI002F91F777